MQVVNLAQMSYNLTQETITLLLELRQGHRPTVAVFLDGHNEFATAYYSGRPGSIVNEDMFAQRYQAGRRGFWGDLLALGRHLATVERLTHATQYALRNGLARPAPNVACETIAPQYQNLVRSVEGWGHEFRFSPIFLWQPLLATSHKPLSRWERAIQAPAGYREALRRCSYLADSLMASEKGRTYFPLHTLYDRDTATVFLDDVGHVTEAGNAVMAARIADVITPHLRTSSTAHGE